jgi:GDP-L-fucose synthase
MAATNDLPLDARIYVAGHRGMVGSAITRALQAAGYRNLLLRSHADTYRADFIHDNLAIQVNVLDEARRAGVKRLLFLGSSCIYPRDAPQPMKEEYLLTGPLEPTNKPYAIAKIAGIEMCDAYRRQYGCDFRAAMPTNLYGPGDNFDLETSHVIPALIRKFHEARISGAPSVTIWGTGTPRREFMHVDDLASACLFLMSISRAEWDTRIRHAFVNVGVGEDLGIRELAELISGIVAFRGRLEFDPSKPDGTPCKLMDVSVMNAIGWRARVTLEDGLTETYRAWSVARDARA